VEDRVGQLQGEGGGVRGAGRPCDSDRATRSRAGGSVDGQSGNKGKGKGDGAGNEDERERGCQLSWTTTLYKLSPT
jgi:hypothetical protein